MAKTDIEFTDNSVKVINAMNDACVAWLHEAAGELASQVKRNTKVGKVAGGKTKGQWKYQVNESKLEAVVGNPNQTAIWLEFGTGEYALKGNGRKGGWHILIGNGSNQISEEVVEAYNFPIKYGKDGKRFAFTRGMKPQRPFYTAFVDLKPKIQKAFEAKMKGLNNK